MSEQKKPKIDLKARLGKKTVAAPGGAAIPPPMGIPKPLGLGGAAPDAGAQAAAPPPPPRVVEPQAIKIEMSEEVVEQQRKAQRRAYIIGAGLSLVTALIGFTFGGSVEKGKGAKLALEGASSLIKEIEAADKVADQLHEVLGKAGERLGKGEFPEEEVSQLGGINIPFDGGNLTDKNIGRFNKATAMQLINYANLAQKANEQKERLQTVLSGAKAGLAELLAQKTDPKVRWGAFVVQGPSGPWANLTILPASFPVKGDWPAELQVRDGKSQANLKRFQKGDLSTGDPQVIPVAPATETSVCPNSTIVKLRSELADMQQVLKGDATPGQEKPGILTLGEEVVKSLKKIGGSG